MEVASIALSLAPAATARAALPPSLPADDLVAQRFSEVMGAGRPAPVQATAAALPPDDPAPAQAAVSSAGLQRPTSLGDAILSGLNRASAQVRESYQRVQGAARSTAPLDLQDLFRLNVEMHSFSFNYELLGKGISKFVQNLDTLTKQQ